MITRNSVGVALTFLIFLAASTQTVFAQDAEDITKIEACLTSAAESATGKPAECIGKLAGACAVELGAGSDADCMLREADTWAAIAKQRFSAFVDKTKPDIADSVRVAQDSWEKFREANCDATGAFYAQYSGSASAQWQALCLRNSAAERALLLDEWLANSEDFE